VQPGDDPAEFGAQLLALIVAEPIGHRRPRAPGDLGHQDEVGRVVMRVKSGVDYGGNVTVRARQLVVQRLGAQDPPLVRKGGDIGGGFKDQPLSVGQRHPRHVVERAARQRGRVGHLVGLNAGLCE
jgi:hypothetical protein